MSRPSRVLPAEWSPQSGVMMAWPHGETEWAHILEDIRSCVTNIAAAVTRDSTLLLVVDGRFDDADRVRARLQAAGIPADRLRLALAPLDDTWARDFGPVTVLEEGAPRLLDFGFNGWGLKFRAADDNRVSERLHEAGVFGATPREVAGLWAEGGALESDGAGTLLVRSASLVGPNRNPGWTRADYEAAFARLLGVRHVAWLERGALIGDDTDAHIDTLARLAPDNTIVYQACDDAQDEHFDELRAMAADLAALQSADGRPFRLLPLPWPGRHVAPDGGYRLPATYANFLVTNTQVLLPVYGRSDADVRAAEVVGEAFPWRTVVPIDCRAAIRQHGSLHCLTMQLPKGVLP